MLKDNYTKRILNVIYRIEDNFVVLLLSGILIVSIIQITLRNFFDSGLIWGDSLLSVLVLWLGLAGSIVASRQGKHINIDILSQYLPQKYYVLSKKIGYLFASSICILITYYSLEFVVNEYFLNEYAFSSIPVWLTESIIPLAFSVMGIRFFLISLLYKSGSTLK
ncbi:hypothetical protein MNBD_GAMMA09-1966 [hydrothermal vent metagenome]|uniref:Tripartite ATP-independent periplasmic transporters DctQ component domain-containing protein n=1 Tax=hydrothermal vent metagenome TaxID=652676 RepID=A0A3B0Y4B2_9ZZZZ